MSGISLDIVTILHVEVESLVEEIAGILFNEPLERQPLDSKLQELRGICRLLELPSAVSLLDELSKTVGTILNKGGNPLAQQPELSVVLDIFPHFFKVLTKVRKHIPFIFMPELAILRRLQGLPPLYEFQLLHNHQWPESSRFHGVTVLSADAMAAVKKLKQLYQMGLLDILRGSNQRKGAEVVAKVAGRLKLIFASEAERHYWSLVECVARAMERGSLDFNPVRLRLLAAVERQLKSLLDGPGQKSAYPLGLWRAFAILLAMVSDKDTAALSVCKWVGAPEFDYTDGDISHARAIIFEGETENLEPFMAEVGASLGNLHSLLELMDSKGHLVEDEAAAFADHVNDLANQCSRHGLVKASSRFHGHHLDILQGQGDWQENSLLLKDIAHSILYIECLMLHVREQGYAIQGLLQKLDIREVDTVIEGKLVDSSISAVWGECLRKLVTVKELIDDIAMEKSGDEVADVLAREFDEICGAAVIVDDIQVRDIAARCRDFVRSHLFASEGGKREVKLSSFADAVVALEYYFQNSRNGEKSDFVLAIADEYLAELEV